MKLTYIAGGALLATSCSAFANPVYLQCAYSYNGVNHALNITLNEELGTSTIGEDGQYKSGKAVFSPNEVKIARGPFDAQLTIDRVNLSLEAWWDGYPGGGPARGVIRVAGKCELQETPARKF